MVSPEFQQHLEVLAARYGRKSGNKVAEEILATYTEFWEAAEAVKEAEVQRQRQALLGTPSIEKAKANKLEKKLVG